MGWICYGMDYKINKLYLRLILLKYNKSVTNIIKCLSINRYLRKKNQSFIVIRKATIARTCKLLAMVLSDLPYLIKRASPRHKNRGILNSLRGVKIEAFRVTIRTLASTIPVKTRNNSIQTLSKVSQSILFLNYIYRWLELEKSIDMKAEYKVARYI